jgi:hypothetical protein
MLIPDRRLEKALAKLAETDTLAADLHAEMKRAEFRAKAVKGALFLRVTGSNATERAAKAESSDEYSTAMDAYFDALKAYERLENERAREVIIIECWRSMNSARTKGLIQ